MKLKKIFLMSIFFLSLVLLPVLAKSLNEWIENGMNLCCEGKYEEAVKCYDKALEINPKNIDVLTKKGTALIDLEDYEESIKCFNSVLEINPKNIDAWLYRGLLLSLMKQYGESIKCYDRALELDPNEVIAWNNKGLIMEELKQYDEAMKCFNKALEIDPEYIDALNNKGYVLKEEGKNEEAIKCFDKIIDSKVYFDDNYYQSIAMESKALILYRMGKYEEAVKCYKRNPDINIKVAEIWYNRGIDLKNQGKYIEAIKWINRALDLKPDYKEAKKDKDYLFNMLNQNRNIYSIPVEPEMVYIQGSMYQKKLRDTCDEIETKTVYVGNFYIGKYPVTNKEYFQYDFSHKNPDDNLPVVDVSWNDAAGYCQWLSKKTGKKYRLPTKAEWEYACCAGTDTLYYWGNEMDGSYCWYDDNSNKEIHPVGQKLPNPWGLYDMAGNVWQWCSDLCDDSRSSRRVIHGGSSFDPEYCCQSLYHAGNTTDYRGFSTGFRIVRIP